MGEFIRRIKEPRSFPPEKHVFVKWAAIGGTMTEDGEYSSPELTRWYVEAYTKMNNNLPMKATIYTVDGEEFKA